MQVYRGGSALVIGTGPSLSGTLPVLSSLSVPRGLAASRHQTQRPHEGASAVHPPRFAAVSNRLRDVAELFPALRGTFGGHPGGRDLSVSLCCSREGCACAGRCGEAGSVPGDAEMWRPSAASEMSLCGHTIPGQSLGQGGAGLS